MENLLQPSKLLTQLNPNSMPTLSPSQADQYQAFQERIKQAGGKWLVALTSEEQDVYTALRAMSKPSPKGPMIPQSYVIDMLDDIYDFVKEGTLRAKLLAYKRKIQKF